MALECNGFSYLLVLSAQIKRPLRSIGFKNGREKKIIKGTFPVSTKAFNVSYHVRVEWSYIITQCYVAARGSRGKQNQQTNGFQETASGNYEKHFGLLIRSDRCYVIELRHIGTSHIADFQRNKLANLNHLNQMYSKIENVSSRSSVSHFVNTGTALSMKCVTLSLFRLQIVWVWTCDCVEGVQLVRQPAQGDEEESKYRWASDVWNWVPVAFGLLHVLMHIHFVFLRCHDQKLPFWRAMALR